MRVLEHDNHGTFVSGPYDSVASAVKAKPWVERKNWDWQLIDEHSKVLFSVAIDGSGVRTAVWSPGFETALEHAVGRERMLKFRTNVLNEEP